MTLLKKMMLAASLFLVSNFASAAVFDMHDLGVSLDEGMDVPGTQIVQGFASAGVFVDFFNFTLTEDSILDQELLYTGGVDWAVFSVLDFGTNNVLGSAVSIGSNLLGVNDLWLSAGDYTTRVISSLGGGYGMYVLGTTITSPVPEASTIAMMLGGLGLVGFMAARRRKTA